MPTKKESPTLTRLDRERHKKVSLALVEATDILLADCKPMAKEPASTWKPKLNDKARTKVILDRLRIEPDLNYGAHLYGPYVDVDVDTENPLLYQFLDAFLPSCSHIWGRKSKPKSHRMYHLSDVTGDFDKSPYRFLRMLPKNSAINIEVRGGDLGRGEYSLMPGSVHPSGETYEWDDLDRAQSSMSVTTTEDLMRGIRLAAAATLIAPYWVEGLRNELVQCLSGLLYNLTQTDTELSESTYDLNPVMTQDRAETLITTICQVTGDDEEANRLRNFRVTWNKAAKGKAVTGGLTLDKVTEPGMASILGDLLTTSDGVMQLQEFLDSNWKWRNRALVIAVDSVGKTEHVIMSERDFRWSRGDKYIMGPDGKKRYLVDIFPKLSRGVNVSEGLTFDPSTSNLIVEDDAGLWINEWTGFRIPPHDQKVKDKEVQPFLEYVREVITAGDQEAEKWVLAWLANLFQHPHRKPGTALVLVGRQGAGKTFLGEGILRPIIGYKHSTKASDVITLATNFNKAFDNVLFVQCDEATNARQRSVAAKLKSLITDKSMRIEPKGVDPYEKPNHMRFLFTSNDIEDAVMVQDGLGDRRYTVLEVSHKYATHEKEHDRFWNHMYAWVEDEVNLSKLHRWLRDHEYNFNYITTPHLTDAKKAMVQRSLDPFDGWLAVMASRQFPLSERAHEHWWQATDFENSGEDKTIVREDWPTWVHMTAMAEDYALYLRSLPAYQREKPMTEQELMYAFDKRDLWPGTYLPKGEQVVKRIKVEYFDQRKGTTTSTTPRLKRCPDLRRIREYLKATFGSSFDREDPTDVIHVVSDALDNKDRDY